jgi:trimeric autotransporter adhesin
MGVGSAQCSHWTTTAPLLVSAAVALLFFVSPLLEAQNSFPIHEARAIRGTVKSSGTAIPGVTITAANTLSGQKTSTSTDVNGKYNLEVSANGRYVVRAQMAAFASSTQEVMIHDNAPTAKADFDLILLSRVQELDKKRGQQASLASGPATQGFRTLSLLQSDSTFAGASGVTGGAESVNSDLLAPGMSNTSGTESVSISANTATSFADMSSEEMRQRFEEFRQQNDGPSGSAGGGGGLGGPGGGGPGGGPGPGFGGPGGGPPPFVLFGGNRGGLNLNRPHGSLFYTVGSDVLNAAPYSLTGQPVAKPGYLQNQFGVNLGGPLRIPKVYANSKTFFFFNYNGSRSENPYDAFSTVPTAAERGGDFSHSTYQGNAFQIFNPYTGTAIPANNLENSGLVVSPIATGLLQYIPLPNVAGATADTQNFHYVTTAKNNSDDLNIRVNRSLGAGAAQLPPGPPGSGGFQGPHNDVVFGFHYHSSNTGLTNPFPSVGGATTVRSFDIPLGYVHSFGKITNLAHVDFNRSRTSTQNLYAFSQNVAGDLGIGGVSQNPFDWGLPNLSFVDFGSLTDTNPQLVRNQTWTFSDNMIWHSGKHTLRWGGDFRRIQLNTEASSDARGTFVFTGLNTAQTLNGAQVANTGFDFADFLLGLPGQTRLQTTEAGANNYHFRGNFWDLYAQEDWRMRGNLTLNLGVRYEYVSPFKELNGHIASLDVSPAFLVNATVDSPNSVELVLPGASSSYHGVYPSTLMHPDRTNFAPRIGIAWKPWPKMIVRAGYGINYNTTAYQNIAQQLAFQPPFATTATNVQTSAGSLTLHDGFPAPALPICQTSGETDCQLTNNYAVNPNYRLGYVQIWNFNVQREIRPTLVLNVDYTGTKGTRLDILEAPNRDQAGIRLATVDAFNWESSGADSHSSAGSVRLRKRLHAGFSIGGTYTFAKSIDDAATVGGTATTVAQNPFNLAAERALSSFNQTHKFTGDYLLEFPFGHDKRWLSDASPWRAILGDWQLSGDWTIASGLPFTPTVLGADVESGTTGTVRANVVPGSSISIAAPTIHRWFNTAAFQAPGSLADCNNPADNPLNLPCVYGDARRNSIIGPGSLLFDMALTKVFAMREGRVLEFRASASNVFNRPQYSSIDTTLNSPTFGQVTAVGSMRTIQLTARLRF